MLLMSSNGSLSTLYEDCEVDFDFFSVFVVAEDVSLTGGAASQRIRLIDEEEQVCLQALF